MYSTASVYQVTRTTDEGIQLTGLFILGGHPTQASWIYSDETIVSSQKLADVTDGRERRL